MKKVRMKQRSLYLIVGLVIASLIGVQLYWMRTSIRLQQQAAERSLKTDLEKVVSDAEENAYCFFYYSKAYIKKNEGIYIIKQQAQDERFIAPPLGYLDTVSMYNLFYFTKDTFFDKSNSLIFNTPATVDISLKFKFAVPSKHVKAIDTNSYKIQDINTDNFSELLNDRQSLNAMINPDNLDSLIKDKLRKNDFDTVYEMGIKRIGNNEFEYLKPGSQPTRLANATMRFSFLGDNFNKPYELFLYLPDPTGYAIRSMAAVMIASIVIILVLILSYAYFVKTILNQAKLSEMKSMFINNITHEFNTPITNINLAVENWRNAGKNGEFYAGIIEEENRHMQRNVAQMLQLATMEHTRLNGALDRIDLNQLVEETVSAFRIQLEKAGGSVEYRFAPGAWMYGDLNLMRNLLYNLVDNAIKYSGSKPKISIATSVADNRVVLEIQDNGIGMSAETMKYMFERFYRGDKSDRHDVKGFGIGLSYVKYIVDAHKGNIQVKSKKGEGTRFTISFPKNTNGVV